MTGLIRSNIDMRFHHYIEGFANNGENLPSALNLKAKHCQCVATEARGLSLDLGWPASAQHTAEATGLLHDVGRFSQFAEFGTFSDAASVDHGNLGAEIVVQAGWLDAVSAQDRHAMIDAIRHHNCLTIPANLPHNNLALLRVIRDADKLDIFRVVLEAVERDGFQELPTMLPNIKLNRSPSPQLVDEIICKKKASMKNVKSLADLLLMQMAWVYDLNYIPALQRFHERGILARILDHLDQDASIHALVKDVSHFVMKRIRATND